MSALQVLTDEIPRHAHRGAYAAVVLSGGYEEAGEAGRFRAEPGDVLVHGAFSAHANRIDRRTVVLNLALPAGHAGPSGRVQVASVDELVRATEADPAAAAALVAQAAARPAGGLDDAPDRLAHALRADGALQVSDWAKAAGVSRETAFRWFRQTYGVAPSRYRVEARARLAWRLVVGTDEALADIALSLGFADQAHMTRDVTTLTGRPPGRWRAQHSFKTDAAPSA